jgi:hypothetical protein
MQDLALFCHGWHELGFLGINWILLMPMDSCHNSKS